MDFLHSANVGELTSTAEKVGAEIFIGALRYQDEASGWQLGGVDLGEHLAKYRDCEKGATSQYVNHLEDTRAGKTRC